MFDIPSGFAAVSSGIAISRQRLLVDGEHTMQVTPGTAPEKSSDSLSVLQLRELRSRDKKCLIQPISNESRIRVWEL